MIPELDNLVPLLKLYITFPVRVLPVRRISVAIKPVVDL